MKRQVTLYLEIDLIEELKQNKINISELVNNLLKHGNKGFLERIKDLEKKLEKKENPEEEMIETSEGVFISKRRAKECKII